jgi:hypothetical protein
LALIWLQEGWKIFVMDLYLKFRLVLLGRMSEWSAACHFGILSASLWKMMSFSLPPGYQRTAQINRPKLGDFGSVHGRGVISAPSTV